MFEWNTGQRSSFEYVISTDPTTGDVGLSGLVTSGPLVGDDITAIPVLLSQDGLCAAGGVRSFQADPAIVTFTD